LLHRETDYFPGLRSVLVYPGMYFATTTRHLGSGIMEERQEARLGEAWPEGTVVLAWNAVCGGASDPRVGTNVVLHEFAHLLDFEDGWSTGAPPLGGADSPSAGRSRRVSWAQVLGAEFERLRNRAQRGEAADLNVYGAQNPAEFFAVATESFFEWPRDMRENHPQLYEQLKGFYRQDPAQWQGETAAPGILGSTEGEWDGWDEEDE
jgi:hypothetical protein